MSDRVNVEFKHAFLCANKSGSCLNVGPDNIVSFGCSNSVVIYQPLAWHDVPRQSLMTYNYHKGKVLCTNWIQIVRKKEISILNYLLTGSTDTTVAIWQYCKNEHFDLRLKKIGILTGHSDSVTTLCGLYDEEKKHFVVVTSSADSTFKVWSGSDLSSIELNQSVDLKSGFVLDVALHCLPKCNVPILACACDDFKVKLYVMKKSDKAVFFEDALHLRGHEDWVRGVDFITVDDDSLYLSSCSQDSFIRLWKITYGDISDQGELALKKHTFSVKTDNYSTSKFSVAIDAVLSGHENWVYSSRWGRSENDDIVLLSASIDKTVLVWTFDVENQIWIDSVRVGEIGGNTLGFYGALFSSNCRHILAHSYTGALHGWDKTEKNSWQPAVVVSGHSSSVNDISWEPKLGRYLVSVSEDQTTRLFCNWKNHGMWHEVARPQIHGYDMQCLAVINSSRFVSGADEKVLRVFEASRNFFENFEKISGYVIECPNGQTAEGATVPALGLSNKAVSHKENLIVSDRREQYIEELFAPIELTRPPPESYLLQNTLWPESRKVYGHVYELYCVACCHSGAIVASAAKSSHAKHAGVMIWDAVTWEQTRVLPGHTLTVTQLEFSPCDNYLLSVSRDRSWILHRVVDASLFEFELAARSEKKSAHSRIIWSCSWSHDSQLFATASRDKKVSIWRVLSGAATSVDRVAQFACGESATAVAFSTSSARTSYKLAVGLESGALKLLELTPDNVVTELLQFNSNLSHCLTTKRLKWRPCPSGEFDKNSQYLATCGQDNQVKLFRITFSE